MGFLQELPKAAKTVYQIDPIAAFGSSYMNRVHL
jgi:hypothetical protein